MLKPLYIRFSTDDESVWRKYIQPLSNASASTGLPLPIDQGEASLTSLVFNLCITRSSETQNLKQVFDDLVIDSIEIIDVSLDRIHWLTVRLPKAVNQIFVNCVQSTLLGLTNV